MICQHRYGETPLSSRAIPRVKPEACEIASLDKGGRMQKLVNSWGKQLQTPRPAPRVKDGVEFANLGQGGRMSRLMHEGDKLSGDLKPPPRATSSSGRRNIRKGKEGSISQIFAESGKWQIVSTPGLRSTQ